MRTISPIVVATVLTLASVGSVPAAHAVDVRFLHAIDPEDAGGNAASIDLDVGGHCVSSELAFGDQVVFSLDPGSYAVEIKLSDGVCGGDLLVSGTINVALQSTPIVVLHLDLSAGAVVNQFGLPVPGNALDSAEVVAYHVATAPTLGIRAVGNNELVTLGIIVSNGQQTFPSGLALGEVTIRINETGRFASIPLADATVFLDSRTNYALFIAGSAIGGTLTLLEVALPGSDDVTDGDGVSSDDAEDTDGDSAAQ